ncbi:TetR/AcrR family transcriptional regulator [Arthrobacter sp. TMN-49]
MTTQPSARDRVLSAYADLLIGDGPRAATLEAVAAAAGVSKGGLLYHFKSKEALTEGLLVRLKEGAEQDFAAMVQDPAGCASYYVRTSVFGGTPFDRAIVAAHRLIQSDDDTVREAFSALHARWYELILGDVGDPAVARVVMLLGDGLYYNAALFGFPTGVKNRSDSQEEVDVPSLLAIVEKLRSGTRS